MLTKGFSILAVVLYLTPAAAQECRMKHSFMQPDGNAPAGQTAVWSDERSSSLFYVESLNVNTDGTRRSYSVDDFWGRRNALNNLCNAMTDACAGLDKAALRERRLITEQAQSSGWAEALLSRTRISSSIIPFKGGKPCPAVDGFLVSATSLAKTGVADVCDVSNYLDALNVPALVQPGNPRGRRSGFAERGAGIGDLAVVMIPESAKPVYAVVGDTGPSGQLGEGSVALNGKLLGKTAEPANYDEIRGKPPYPAGGWVVPRAIVLVFPASRDPNAPFMSTGRIDMEAGRLFDEWGGADRLTACEKEYRQR